jgi:hypothetical protein
VPDLAEVTERRLLLERKKRLLSQRELLRQDFGLCFYHPYSLKDGTPGPQERFHRAGAFKHRLWEAGNKGGKTHGGTAEDCAFLLGERPWYAKTDPARTLGIPQKPNVGLIIAAKWDKVGDLFTGQTSDPKTTGRVWQLLPRGFVKRTKRNHSGVISYIECYNGSILRFDTVQSFESDPGGSESSDYDFIHVDEPCPQGMYKAHARGLIPTDGKDWFLLTALKEPWIHDMFFPSRRIKFDASSAPLITGSKWAIRSSTYDNTTLTPEAIKDFEDSLTADERQCRIHGIPLELSGLVYKEFNWDTHVLQQVPVGWANYNDPPLSYTIYVAIDPHPQTPHAVLFLAVAPTGEWFLYDEIFVHCTIEELCKHINARLAQRIEEGGQVRYVPRFNPRTICDPYAFNTFPVLGRHGKHLTMADEFLEHGVVLTKATKALEQGILAVKSVLKTVNRLYVSPQLDETLSEFTHYAWDEKENKPKDENDHMMENLYRLVLEEPQWISSESTNFQMDELTIDRSDLSLPDFSLD